MGEILFGIIEAILDGKKKSEREEKARQQELQLEAEKMRKLNEDENAKEYFCKICKRIHTKKSNIGKGHYNREKN